MADFHPLTSEFLIVGRVVKEDIETALKFQELPCPIQTLVQTVTGLRVSLRVKLIAIGA
jgi:hypothetical protein